MKICKKDNIQTLKRELLAVLAKEPRTMGWSDNDLFLRITNKSDRPLLLGKFHELRKSGRFSNIRIEKYSDCFCFRIRS